MDDLKDLEIEVAVEDVWEDLAKIDTWVATRYPWDEWEDKCFANPERALNITRYLRAGMSKKNIHGQAKKRGLRAMTRGAETYLAKR